MTRLLRAVMLVAAGAVFGSLMTFGHQASLLVGDTEIPWGLCVSVLGVATLLIGTRLLSSGRRPVLWVAVGVVGSVLMLSLPGPGGSVIVPDGTLGMIWALAPSFVAILIVMWPAPRTGSAPRAV